MKMDPPYRLDNVSPPYRRNSNSR